MLEGFRLCNSPGKIFPLICRNVKGSRMIKSLDLVKSYMSCCGWSDGGNPGSVKRDINDGIVARRGDSTWIADVEAACVALMRVVSKTETTLS
jgi:hypothetical protein